MGGTLFCPWYAENVSKSCSNHHQFWEDYDVRFLYFGNWTPIFMFQTINMKVPLKVPQKKTVEF